MMKDKFTKDDIGVYVVGGDENNPEQQAIKILEFAMHYGYDGITSEELAAYKKDYDENFQDQWLDWYEDMADELEFALAYLNIYKCEQGVGFTFVDTNLALIGANGLDNSPVDKVE